MFDDKGNIIQVCMFESYLAKFFLENSEIFNPIMVKIFAALEEYIQKQIEIQTPQFDRRLFSIFSLLKEIDASITNFDQLKTTRSLLVIDTFLKFFTENVMSLSQPTLEHSYALEKSMRPLVFFHSKHRGVREIKKASLDWQSHLGILSEEDCPEDLKKSIFQHKKSRNTYKPVLTANTSIWLKSHGLPIISGISGSIGITVSRLSTLVDFSMEDYYLLGLLIASSTIALGHHSFFEVLLPLSHCKLIEPIAQQDNLLAFYEQMIPGSIRRLPAYSAHLENKKCGSELLLNPLEPFETELSSRVKIKSKERRFFVEDLTRLESLVPQNEQSSVASSIVFS